MFLQSTFLEQLRDLLVPLDNQLFYYINSVWTGPWFDLFFPNITDLHRNHFALFLFSVIGLVWIYRQKTRALQGLLVLILAVAAADLFSYRVVKQYFHRDRPAAAGLPVQLKTENHSGSSFPSNHAANIFAAATIVTAIYPPYFLIAFFVAFAVAYSRVYVGVHYPTDILAGAVIGIILAKIIWSFVRTWVEPDEVAATYHTTRSRFSILRGREQQADRNRRARKNRKR